MSDTQVLEALTEVLVERLKVDRAAVKAEADLFDDLGLDSIDMMTAVMAIEEKFGIEVADSELENVTTVGQAVDLLSEKAGARA